jgi:hypothetical protein
LAAVAGAGVAVWEIEERVMPWRRIRVARPQRPQFTLGTFLIFTGYLALAFGCVRAAWAIKDHGVWWRVAAAWFTVVAVVSLGTGIGTVLGRQLIGVATAFLIAMLVLSLFCMVSGFAK